LNAGDLEELLERAEREEQFAHRGVAARGTASVELNFD
jgi:hypothetical protein